MKRIHVLGLVVSLVSMIAFGDEVPEDSFDTLLNNAVAQIEEGLPIQTPAEIHAKEQVRLELRRKVSEFQKALDEHRFRDAHARLWDIFSWRGYVINYDTYAALSGRLSAKHAAFENKLIADYAASRQSAVRQLESAENIKDLDGVIVDMATFPPRLEAAKPYSAQLELSKIERELPELVRFVTLFQKYLNLPLAEPRSRRESLVQEMTTINQRFALIDHSMLIGMERPPGDPTKAPLPPPVYYEDIVPAIRTLADLDAALPQLQSVRDSLEEDTGLSKRKVRQIEILLRLKGMLDDINLGRLGAAFEDISRSDLFFAQNEEQLTSLIQALRRESTARIIDRDYADIPGLDAEAGIEANLQRALDYDLARENWDGIMNLFDLQRSLGPLITIPTEERQADVQAIKCWKRAHQYYNADQFDYAVANLLDILELVGKYGPYTQAQETLQKWGKKYPEDYSAALLKAREWRANDAAMNHVLGFFARASYRTAHPMMMAHGRWQDFQSMVAEEVVKVLAATKEADIDPDPASQRMRRPRP